MTLRIEQQSGEWINRNQEIKFSFEGRAYTAYQGDSISSALWAADKKVLGRSFKYHRPRGVLSLANHDVNVMLTDGIDTNIRGDAVEVKQNMSLTAVNTQGGVIKDRGRFIEMLASFLPVGFYYKAFHKPRFMFPFWERIIRNAAGLGKVNFNYPRIPKPKLNTQVDVLVVGAGPSGLAAAIAAAVNKKLQILIVDENAHAGGSYGYDRAGSDIAKNQMDKLLNVIKNTANITLKTNAYAASYYTDHLIPIVEKSGITRVRASALIVATGAFEQPPVFRNNDLPGVMNASAAQRMIYRYAVKPFNEGVVFTANAYGYRAAHDLLHAGVIIKAIVDLRPQHEEDNYATALANQGVQIYNGHCVHEVIASSNKMGVKAVVICPFNDKNNSVQTEESVTIDCDGVIMSAGWAPAAALLYQSGMKVRYDYAIEQFVPDQLIAGVFAAGRVNGIYDLAQRIADGSRAAADAMRWLGVDNAPQVQVTPHSSDTPSHPYPIIPHQSGRNFVDFDEDIQAKDFINAAKEGFDNIELMKRFTTVGMGPSQGKHSNMNAIRMLAKIRQLPVEKIGSTTARPFFHPTPIGHLGGRNFHPHRQSHLQAWHKQANAVFIDVGAWSRPAYYQHKEQDKASLIQQESVAVHKDVGIIDGSSLGKIEICGPDAAVFLERFFTGKFANQKKGEIRYALSLDEAGIIADDGIVSCVADELFYLTIGTSNAGMVYREMQRWLQRWQLDVSLINVTGAYAIINVVGPKSEAVVAAVINSAEIASATFPVNSVKTLKIGTLAIRVMRITFVAEQGYEIHVPASHALTIWQDLMAAGEQYNIRPFGTDAQRLLRLEMGHYLPGYDTDGLTVPYELGCESALDMQKSFFVGQRSLQIIAKKPINKRLVPFVLSPNFSGEMPQDCNLVIEGKDIKGRVTSVSYSTKVNRVIGFAYVSPEKIKAGSTFEIRTDNGSLVVASVTSTPFVNDKTGENHD